MKFFKKNNKKSFNRSIRVSQDLRKEISYILQNNINDPRINFMTTISDITLSNDLSSAKIFISYLYSYKNSKNFFKNKHNKNEILDVLKKASNYIRKILSKKLNLRVIPILNFYSDDSLITGIKMSNLIKYTLKK